MIKYNDFYDLLERFSIMTIDGKTDDKRALQQLKNATTDALYRQLEDFINKQNKSPVQAHNEHITADIETLSKYINAGFQLYPCYEKQKDIFAYMTLSGKLKLYENDEAKEKKERSGIKDINTLKDVVLKGLVDQYGKHHKINYFRLFPLDNKKQRYIVIDIDHHEGKGNGFPQWRSYIKSKHLEGIDYLYNLDNFPCYVQSANEGIHLYFKLIDFPTPENIKNLTENVEVKGLNSGITAGGTYREASKNKFYKLHGSFEDAPPLPMEIYIDIQTAQKEREAQAQKPLKTFTNTKQYGASNGNKWNSTLEGMYTKAQQNNEGGNHSFILKFCTYVKHAIENGNIQASKSNIETFLYSCPEVLQHEKGDDKGDTQHIINDFFN